VEEFTTELPPLNKTLTDFNVLIKNAAVFEDPTFVIELEPHSTSLPPTLDLIKEINQQLIFVCVQPYWSTVRGALQALTIHKPLKAAGIGNSGTCPRPSLRFEAALGTLTLKTIGNFGNISERSARDATRHLVLRHPVELCGINVDSTLFHHLWNKTCLREIKLGERGKKYMGARNKTMGAWNKMVKKKGILVE
jgi:hypothetical protein